MFQSYILSRQATLMGFRLRLSLYVDIPNEEASAQLLVDGRITNVGTPPRIWEVDTPAKAEEWFKRIDLDRLAEVLWLDQKARGGHS